MEPEPQLSFFEHKSFSKEIEKFNKKYDRGMGFRHLKALLAQYFDPINPKICISPKVMHRVDRLGVNIQVYKATMAVKGLSSGQCPRVCFWHTGNLITFLCLATHIENYKDSVLKENIKTRISMIDPSIEFN